MRRFLSIAFLLAAAASAGADDFPDATPYFETGPAAGAAQAFAKGEWQTARDGFAAVLAGKDAPSDRAARARLVYLLGRCDLKLGQYAKAAGEFDAAGADLPVLADHAAYEAATAYLEARALDQAADRAQKVPATSVLAAEAKLVLGDVLREASKWPDEAALYEGYLKDGSIRVAEARFRLAQAYEQLGRDADALPLYAQVAREAPLESWADLATKRVDALSKKLKTTVAMAPADYLARGKVYFDAMRNDLAEADFTTALKSASKLTDDQRCEAAYDLAQTVFKERQRPRAAPLFDDAIADCEKTKNADLQERAVYQGGRSWSSAGDYKKAITLFERAQSWHPDHSYADDSVVREAEEYEYLERGGDKDAGAKITSLLSAVGDRFPDGDMKAEALWRLAWRAWQAQKWDEVVTWLQKEMTAVPHDDNYWAEGQTYYWIGRAEEKLGKTADAEASWTACVHEYPLSYYSLLSLNRLRETDQKAFDKLVAELKQPAAPAPLAFAPRPLYGDAHIRAGVELLRLGLGEDAERELAAGGLKVDGGKKKATDPDEIDRDWATAFLYDRAGLFDKSHWIGRWAARDYERAWPAVNARAKWEIAYPKAFWPILDAAAKLQGYPTELLIAFVREESAFDPLDESFANAIGLTQMIIPTAQRFGKGLGFPIDREDLRDPEKNVAVGSRWLAFLWTSFHQDLPLLIAGYNAGEGAVGKWLCDRGTWATDEWQEAIPYDETRLYTKRVLATYFVYSWLKDGTIPVVSNVIPSDLIKGCKKPK